MLDELDKGQDVPAVDAALKRHEAISADIQSGVSQQLLLVYRWTICYVLFRAGSAQYVFHAQAVILLDCRDDLLVSLATHQVSSILLRATEELDEWLARLMICVNLVLCCTQYLIFRLS